MQIFLTTVQTTTEKCKWKEHKYKIAEFINQWTTHFYYYFNLFCLNIMSPDAGSLSLGLLRKVLLFSWIWKESKGWSLTLWLPYIDTKNEEK